MHQLTIFFILTVLGQALQENLYNFRPASRHLDVNENDEVIVTFDEIANNTKLSYCYISSTVCNIEYPIWETGTGDGSTNDQLCPSDFSPWNKIKSCGFSFKNYNSEAPRTWVLTATDNITATNYTEHVTVGFYYNMDVYLPKFTIFENAAVVNFLKTNDSINLVNCTLEFAEKTVELNIRTIQTTEDPDFGPRLQSFGGGRCGYKITQFLATDPGVYTLKATDEQNKSYRGTTTGFVTKSSYLVNRTIEVQLGAGATVYCGKKQDSSTGSTDQKFCYLYNPRGELVSHDVLCAYRLEIVTVEDLGRWQCVLGFDYTMDALFFTADLYQKNPETVLAISEDTVDYQVIGCQLIDSGSVISYCRFTRPDGALFKVVEGTASRFYNTLTTDLKNLKCSIEVLKPLRDEDKGSWKCEGVFAQEAAGTFINIGNSTGTSYAFSNPARKNIRLGTPFTIECLVAVSSYYCHIIAPNGTEFEPDNPRSITTGLCKLSVLSATVSDNGTWSCSIAQPNGIADKLIQIDVSVLEVKLLSGDIEAVDGEEITLLCNTNGIPIQYCRFVDPYGNAYSLRPDSTSNNINYHGQGLEYGDCGLKILNAGVEDSGVWTCYLNAVSKLTGQIQVTVRLASAGRPLAESVGIAAGVLVVLIIAGAVLYYKYSSRVRCRRGGVAHETTVQYQARHSTGSGTSGESVALEVVKGNVYNTTATTESCVKRKTNEQRAWGEGASSASN